MRIDVPIGEEPRHMPDHAGHYVVRAEIHGSPGSAEVVLWCSCGVSIVFAPMFGATDRHVTYLAPMAAAEVMNVDPGEQPCFDCPATTDMLWQFVGVKVWLCQRCGCKRHDKQMERV